MASKSVTSCRLMHNFVKIYYIIIIITLFQEDNIFGRVASLTYGPQLTNVGMIFIPPAFMPRGI